MCPTTWPTTINNKLAHNRGTLYRPTRWQPRQPRNSAQHAALPYRNNISRGPSSHLNNTAATTGATRHNRDVRAPMPDTFRSTACGMPATTPPTMPHAAPITLARRRVVKLSTRSHLCLHETLPACRAHAAISPTLTRYGNQTSEATVRAHGTCQQRKTNPQR